jgi:hypothetical protein
METVQAHGLRLDQRFYTPLWRSNWLSAHLSQYCLFMRFVRNAP